MTREQYNYAFAGYAFDEVRRFDSEEEAVEFFNEIKANKFYCDAEILKGETLWVNTTEMKRWKADSWKVCWNKVPFRKRVAMAINA